MSEGAGTPMNTGGQPEYGTPMSTSGAPMDMGTPTPMAGGKRKMSSDYEDDGDSEWDGKIYHTLYLPYPNGITGAKRRRGQ